MDLKQLVWCDKQKNGFGVIEPNVEVRDSYFRKADEALKVVNLLRNENLDDINDIRKKGNEFKK